MQQLPGPSQTHLAWKSAFQAKIPFYFYAICISLAFWKNFKKQDMSPAVVGTPPGLGIFRTKVPDGQGHAWRMSFVEMIDAVSSRAEYCSHLFTWINSINIYMPDETGSVVLIFQGGGNRGPELPTSPVLVMPFCSDAAMGKKKGIRVSISGF